MSAPISPRDELRTAAAKLAAILGFPPPEAVDLRWAKHPPLPVLCAEPEPPKLSRNESLIYQAIRQADEPLQAKQIEAIVDLGHTTVSKVLTSLRQAGLIVRSGKDGYAPAPPPSDI